MYASLYIFLCLHVYAMLNTLLVTLCNHSYYKIGSIYSSIDLGKLKVVHAEMLSEEKIHEWWNQKIENYL